MPQISKWSREIAAETHLCVLHWSSVLFNTKYVEVCTNYKEHCGQFKVFKIGFSQDITDLFFNNILFRASENIQHHPGPAPVSWLTNTCSFLQLCEKKKVQLMSQLHIWVLTFEFMLSLIQLLFWFKIILQYLSGLN